MSQPFFIVKKNGTVISSGPTTLNFITNQSITESDGVVTIGLTDIRGGLFGDKSDGDVTINGTTTLTRDMFYDNLTVEGTLNTASFKVFVGGTLTVNGVIQCNGGDADAEGQGGVCVPEGTLPAMGNGGSADSGIGTTISDGIGVAGLGTSNFTALTAAKGGVRFIDNAIQGKWFSSSSNGFFYGNGTNSGGVTGGSGANGGFVVVVARKVLGSGIIQALGGAGYLDGRGGNGGIVVFVYGANASDVATDVSGGTGNETGLDGVLMEFNLG